MFALYDCPLVISVMNQVSSIPLALAAAELNVVPGIHPYRLVGVGGKLQIDLSIVKTASRMLDCGYNLCVYPADLSEILDIIDISTTSLEILRTGTLPNNQDLNSLIESSGVTTVNRLHDIPDHIRSSDKNILLLKGSGGAGVVGKETIEQLAAKWAVSPSRSMTTWFSGGLGQRGLVKTLLDRYPGTRCSIGTLAAVAKESPLSDWAAKQLITRSSELETAGNCPILGQKTTRCIRWGTGNTRTDGDWNQTSLLNNSISASSSDPIGMIYAGILDQLPVEWQTTRPTLRQVVNWVLDPDTDIIKR